MSSYKLTVKNLRPFGQNGKEAVFDLKPLTLLIGPNNSGKSTLIKLIKCISLNLDDAQFKDEHIFNLNYGFGKKTTFANLISSGSTDDFIKIKVETDYTKLELILKKHNTQKHLAYISEMNIEKNISKKNEIFSFTSKIDFIDGLYRFETVKFDDYQYFKNILKILDEENSNERSIDDINFSDLDVIKNELERIKEKGKYINLFFDKEKRDFYLKNQNLNTQIFLNELIFRKLSKRDNQFLFKGKITNSEETSINNIVKYFTDIYKELLDFNNDLYSSNDSKSLKKKIYFNQFTGIKPEKYDNELIDKLKEFKRPQKELEKIEEKFNVFLKKFKIGHNIKIELQAPNNSDSLFSLLPKNEDSKTSSENNDDITPTYMYYYYFNLFLFSKHKDLKEKCKKDYYQIFYNLYFHNRTILGRRGREGNVIDNFDDIEWLYDIVWNDNDYIYFPDTIPQIYEFLTFQLQILQSIRFIHNNKELIDDIIQEIENIHWEISNGDIEYPDSLNYEKYIEDYINRTGNGYIINKFDELKQLNNELIDSFKNSTENLFLKEKLEIISFFSFSIIYNLCKKLKFKSIFDNILKEVGFKYKIKNDKLVIYKKENGKKSSISNYGSGLKNYVRFILFIGMIPLSDYLFSFIEEPESNQHPNKLKDYAKYFLSPFSIDESINKESLKKNFTIIETHSEYLIRNLQLLIAEGEKYNQLYNSDDIIIYNFSNDPTSEDYIKEIVINKDGSLSQFFGPGFYNETANLIYKLCLIDMEEK